MKEELGMFMGKQISEMTRDELLYFAKWAAHRIQELETIASETEDYRLSREIKL